MSKSFKKYPSGKWESSCKFGQRQANKRVRRTLQDIPNGKAYKKIYKSWSICDYKFVAFLPSEKEKYKECRRK